ncbi:MAG: hypothetical protein KDI48_02135 [Xanthomonadales bacterium]|nr:hypothetical protein [Xanthomonadales bacterium]
MIRYRHPNRNCAVARALRRWFGSDPLHVVVARFQQGHSFPLIKGGKA